MTADKAFLLETGAQKGGTRWLFRYLKDSPQFVRGCMNEHFVFDVLDLETEAATRSRLVRRAEEALEVLRERHDEPNYAMRTRYDGTVAALDEAFEQDEVYYAFHEDFFTESWMREICAFVGIDYLGAADLERRRNASNSPPEPSSDDTVRVVASHIRKVYAAIAERFPEVDVEELWPSARWAQ